MQAAKHPERGMVRISPQAGFREPDHVLKSTIPPCSTHIDQEQLYLGQNSMADTTHMNLRPNTLFSAALLLLISSSLSLADIYRWKDAEGNTVYSDQQSSSQAKKAPLNNKSVNYYSAPKPKETAKTPMDSISADNTLATLEALEDENSAAEAPLSEADCQQLYRRSCDEVVNWEKYARKACGNDSRCSDPDYLDRKYRPRSTAELREVARRAAVRKNNIDDKIDDYLRKKFSNQCENQAKYYCAQQRARNCMEVVVSQCEDPRSLNQVLAKYNNLTLNEKRAIVDKAKKMALASGEDSLNYDELIASLVDILISSAIMGL